MLIKYFFVFSFSRYLTGDQFRSNSSVEMYSNAIRKGCRCVESKYFSFSNYWTIMEILEEWFLDKNRSKQMVLLTNIQPTLFWWLIILSNKCFRPNNNRQLETSVFCLVYFHSISLVNHISETTQFSYIKKKVFKFIFFHFNSRYMERWQQRTSCLPWTHFYFKNTFQRCHTRSW